MARGRGVWAWPWALVAGLSCAALGCGSGGGGSRAGDGSGGTSGAYGLPAATIEGYEGTYRLDSLTKNPAGCDVEGPSILADEKKQLFVLVGAPNGSLGLGPCTDPDTCLVQTDTIRRGDPLSGNYGAFFGWQHDASSLYDEAADRGVDRDGMCVGREWLTFELERTMDGVREERRGTPLPDVPTCVDYGLEGWEAQAAGYPCGELLVASGTKTGPLPE